MYTAIISFEGNTKCIGNIDSWNKWDVNESFIEFTHQDKSVTIVNSYNVILIEK